MEKIYVYTYMWIWRSLMITACAPRGSKPTGLEGLLCSTPHLDRKVSCCLHTSKGGVPQLPTQLNPFQCCSDERKFFFKTAIVLQLKKKIKPKNSTFMTVTKITVIISSWWDYEWLFFSRFSIYLQKSPTFTIRKKSMSIIKICCSHIIYIIKYLVKY